MKKVYTPRDESELAVIRSILDSAEIPYYIKNEHFGSLYIGPAMGGFNSKPIFVSEEYVEQTKELLSNFINNTEGKMETSKNNVSFLNRIVVILEFISFGLFTSKKNKKC